MEPLIAGNVLNGLIGALDTGIEEDEEIDAAHGDDPEEEKSERTELRHRIERRTEQTVELIRGLEKVLGRGSLLAYLIHMTLRIVEIHRVLKDDGFLVLVFLEADTWLPGLRESGLFKPYTAEEVEALAEESGFTGISIQRKTLPQGNGLALVAMK
jgi:hypothetical protein